MEPLYIFFVIASALIAYSVTKEIFTIRKTSTSISEARRFFENNSNAELESQSLKASVYTRGLALAKSKKDMKYDLIPQSKLCDLGLS